MANAKKCEKHSRNFNCRRPEIFRRAGATSRSRTNRCRSACFGANRHLESSKKINPETLRIGINDNLPASINLLLVENARRFFMPPSCREPQLSLSYRQKTHRLCKRYVWWIKDNLNINKMQQALNLFQASTTLPHLPIKGWIRKHQQKLTLKDCG